MQMIAAIETRYAGCRFRSRLEARWAVFFDHLGIPWQYEPQGYLVDGKPYLPDFRLTECDTWVEVKGDSTGLDPELLERAAWTLPEATTKRGRGPQLLLLGPLPRPLSPVAAERRIGRPWIHMSGGDWGWQGWSIEGPPEQREMSCQWWGFGMYHHNRRPWWLGETSSATPRDYHRSGDSLASWLVPAHDGTEQGASAAYAAALSARFEHGESGA
jgi:hypothetical protein